MTEDDELPTRQTASNRALERRLRDRAAALTAEGRDDLADLVRAWADLHAMRGRGRG